MPNKNSGNQSTDFDTDLLSAEQQRVLEELQTKIDEIPDAVAGKSTEKVRSSLKHYLAVLSDYYGQQNQVVNTNQGFAQLPNEETHDDIRNFLIEALRAYSQDQSPENKNDLEKAMAMYEEFLHGAFGITISHQYSDILLVNAAQSLLNYGEGAETIADLFARLYADNPEFFSDLGFSDFNRYAFFRAILGDITIVQRWAPYDLWAVTLDCVETDSEDKCVAWRLARSYTRGHEIDDIWAYSYEPPNGEPRTPGKTYEGTYSVPMTADNFAHELMHSLLNSSTFGNYEASELQSFVDFMKQELDNAGNKAVHEGDWGEKVEIIADYLTTLAHGDVNIGLLGEQLQTAITNAILHNHHISPQTVAEALGTSVIPSSDGSEPTIFVTVDTKLRPRPQLNEYDIYDLRTAHYAVIDAGTAVDLLGRTDKKITDSGVPGANPPIPLQTEYWVYIHAVGYSMYGWTRADLIEKDGQKLSVILNNSPDILGVY